MHSIYSRGAQPCPASGVACEEATTPVVPLADSTTTAESAIEASAQTNSKPQPPSETIEPSDDASPGGMNVLIDVKRHEPPSATDDAHDKSSSDSETGISIDVHLNDLPHSETEEEKSTPQSQT